MFVPMVWGLALVAVAVGDAVPARPAGVDEVVAAVSPENLRSAVDRLAGFGTRHTLSETTSEVRGIGAARRWLRQELLLIAASSGCDDCTVELRRHIQPPGGRVPGETEIVNVVMTVPGTMPEASDRIYVVLGHYDSRNADVMDASGDAPGANDDASGTAAVLELARVFASRRCEATLVFLMTAGEEQGLLGARWFARTAAESGLDIRAALSNDIIGDPTGTEGKVDRGRVRVFSEAIGRQATPQELRRIRRLSAANDSPSRQLARLIYDVAARHDLPVKPWLIYRPDRFLRGGDHAAFNEQGFAAVRFTEVHERYDRQHADVRIVDGRSYGDVAENVDSGYLADVTRLNAAVLYTLANAPSRPPAARLMVASLSESTVIRWDKSPEPDVAGYEVVYRDTSGAVWDHVIDVGDVTEHAIDLSKDNWFFGVRAYDREGHRSPVSFPDVAPRPRTRPQTHPQTREEEPEQRLLQGRLLRSPDRFETLPGYERYKLVSESMDELSGVGRVGRVVFGDDEVTFVRGDRRYRLDLTTRVLSELPESPQQTAQEQRPPRSRGPARGGQSDRAPSPDGKWEAVCIDYNVLLEPSGGGDPVFVTTAGDRKLRYGMASWVYGEELRQSSAMWWSPDSTKLAFYEFDESAVKDFYLTTGLTEWRTELAIEGYPKAGEPNPLAMLLVYDLKSKTRTRVDVGDDHEQYIYDVRFSPDGALLLFNRTNRLQNVLEVVAADPETGESRVVVTETQRTWQKNRPSMRFLEDGERFIWETEKTGWRQYELRHIDGHLICTLSRGDYPAGSILRVDEEAGVMYYMAYSGACPLNAHLHRVLLDGTGQARLTPEQMNHRVWLSPDGKWFVSTYETVETPPTTALFSTESGRVAILAESDTSRFDELGLQPPELFTCKAADGVTDLYGVLFKPSGFVPGRSYPLVIDVYGGPQSQRVRNRWRPANPYCELGFLIAVIDNRGTGGRGKAFEEAVYLKCGTVDLVDQVAGVRFLTQRPWIDGGRVGVFGHSYGGYMSALAILKYPDVFHVAVSSSPVTDWRNYDTIYTERYMRTPQENPDGYDEGSCLTYVEQLSGKLLLMHGMVDDNVHPSNSWQLVHALQEAQKPFSMVFFPNFAHRLGKTVRPLRWEFLYEHLIGDEGGSVMAGRGDEATERRRSIDAASGGVRRP